MRDKLSKESGFSVSEVLVVTVVMGVIVAVSIPSLLTYLNQRHLDSSAARVQSMTFHARQKALKEKVPHRLIFHDALGSPKNRIELQREQGGSFVTIAKHTYDMPDGILILGSGATNSMDTLTISSRGECTAGKVYIENRTPIQKTVSIETTCSLSST